MANFGALTDHFSLADTIGKLVDASDKTPRPQTRKDALDENGDIADSAWHGNTAGTLYDVSCVYEMHDHDLDLSALAIGQKAPGVVIVSIEVATQNSSNKPRVTVTGVLGTSALEQDKAYALPEITLKPYIQAQAMGIEVTTGKLNSCNLSASCELAEILDGEGEPLGHGVSGAMMTATGEAVATSSAAPVLAPAVGWAIATGPGLNEPQADWHRGTLTVEKSIPVTITPPA